MPFLGFVSESSLFCVLVYTNMKTLFYYFTFCGDFYLRKYEETKLLITILLKSLSDRPFIYSLVGGETSVIAVLLIGDNSFL